MIVSESIFKEASHPDSPVVTVQYSWPESTRFKLKVASIYTRMQMGQLSAIAVEILCNAIEDLRMSGKKYVKIDEVRKVILQMIEEYPDLPIRALLKI